MKAKGLVESLVGFSAEEYVEEGGEGAEETLACSHEERGIELLGGSAVYVFKRNGHCKPCERYQSRETRMPNVHRSWAMAHSCIQLRQCYE